MRQILGWLGIVWASPWTLVGLLVGVITILGGGSGRRTGRTIEFWGGPLSRLMRRWPPKSGAVAMALGHVVLGVNAVELERSRSHELVHVAQYERWGIFFIPAYLACSLVLWVQGRDFYRENPFEREAFDRCEGGG